MSLHQAMTWMDQVDRRRAGDAQAGIAPVHHAQVRVLYARQGLMLQPHELGKLPEATLPSASWPAVTLTPMVSWRQWRRWPAPVRAARRWPIAFPAELQAALLARGQRVGVNLAPLLRRGLSGPWIGPGPILRGDWDRALALLWAREGTLVPTYRFPGLEPGPAASSTPWVHLLGHLRGVFPGVRDYRGALGLLWGGFLRHHPEGSHAASGQAEALQCLDQACAEAAKRWPAAEIPVRWAYLAQTWNPPESLYLTESDADQAHRLAQQTARYPHQVAWGKQLDGYRKTAAMPAWVSAAPCSEALSMDLLASLAPDLVSLAERLNQTRGLPESVTVLAALLHARLPRVRWDQLSHPTRGRADRYAIEQLNQAYRRIRQEPVGYGEWEAWLRLDHPTTRLSATWLERARQGQPFPSLWPTPSPEGFPAAPWRGGAPAPCPQTQPKPTAVQEDPSWSLLTLVPSLKILPILPGEAPEQAALRWVLQLMPRVTDRQLRHPTQGRPTRYALEQLERALQTGLATGKPAEVVWAQLRLTWTPPASFRKAVGG